MPRKFNLEFKQQAVNYGGISTPNLRYKNCADIHIENTVIQFSIEHPHLGQQKIALKMKAKYGMDISPGGVRSPLCQDS